MSHYKDPYGINQYNGMSPGFLTLLNLFMRTSNKKYHHHSIWSWNCILLDDACNHFKPWSRSMSFCSPQGSFHGMAKSATSSRWKLHHQCGRDTWQANFQSVKRCKFRCTFFSSSHFHHFNGKRRFHQKGQKPTWRILKVYKMISLWTWCERNDSLIMGLAAWCSSEGDEPLVQWTPLGFAEYVWQNYTEDTSNMFQWIYTLQWVFQALHGDEVVFLRFVQKILTGRISFWRKPCSIFTFGKVWSMWCTVCQIPNPDIVIPVASLWWLGSWYPKNVVWWWYGKGATHLNTNFTLLHVILLCICASWMKFEDVASFRLSLCQIMTRW